MLVPADTSENVVWPCREIAENRNQKKNLGGAPTPLIIRMRHRLACLCRRLINHRNYWQLLSPDLQSPTVPEPRCLPPPKILAPRCTTPTAIALHGGVLFF
jgi:hypothetical protein